MTQYTNVFVTLAGGGQEFLVNGTGTGNMKKIACSKFPATSRPVVGTRYNILVLADGDQFSMDWDATCTFSGEVSEFQS
ncbi:MAG: hypothetical protein ACN4GR_17450 [Arenicellales bacterium]